MNLLGRAIDVLHREGPLALARRGVGFVKDNPRSVLRAGERFSYDHRHETTRIFEEEWDTMLLLDACRYDLWNEVGSERSFFEQADHGSIRSPASSSSSWMQANFTDEYADEMADTAYVTANPFSKEHVDRSNFDLVAEVWRDRWDDELGVVPPETMTDVAIDVARAGDHDRLLVHYMQPHFPAIGRPDIGAMIDPQTNGWVTNIWNELRDGDVDRETVWNAYRENLHVALDHVETLLENHDASTVVITSDHGNGFGEDGIYGHPGRRAHDVLRHVPYCVTEATDSGAYTPDVDQAGTEETTEEEVEGRLKALGYLTDE